MIRKMTSQKGSDAYILVPVSEVAFTIAASP
jgi:hypothetical protein